MKVTYNSRNVTKTRKANRLRWDDGDDRPDRRRDLTKEQHLIEKRMNNALRSRHIEEFIDDDLEVRF